MVRLRFQRKGRTHRPFYRLAAVDSRFKGNGKFIELLGWFDPMAADDGKRYEFKGDRIQYWLGVGAQPSDTVADLLAKEDLLTPKLKSTWEKRREQSRNRVQAKVSVERAERALEALAALAGDAEADMSKFQETAATAVRDAKQWAASGRPAEAEKQAEVAEGVLAEAQKADEEAKKKKAEEEAAAAAGAEAAKEAEGGDSAEGESSES